MTPELLTKYVFTITARIGPVTSAGDIGHGVRRIIPIIGGEVRGPKVNGKVLAFGADFQIIRPNELIDLEAKYAFETDDEKYGWLMQHIFVASAARHVDRVVIDVHQVL